MSVGERAVDVHLDGALGEAFLLTALAILREVRRLAVRLEGGLVLVLLVEEEEIGVFRRAVRPVHEAARLALAHDAGLLLQQRRQRVALALRCANLRDYRHHVSHGGLLIYCGEARRTAGPWPCQETAPPESQGTPLALQPVLSLQPVRVTSALSGRQS